MSFTRAPVSFKMTPVWGPLKGPRGPSKGPRGLFKGLRGGSCRCRPDQRNLTIPSRSVAILAQAGFSGAQRGLAVSDSRVGGSVA